MHLLCSDFTLVSYLSKVAIKPTPPALGTPLGVILFEFCVDFWHHKTRVPGHVALFAWS